MCTFPSPLLSAQLVPPQILLRPKEKKKKKVAEEEINEKKKRKSTKGVRGGTKKFSDGTGWLSLTRSPPLNVVVPAVSARDALRARVRAFLRRALR